MVLDDKDEFAKGGFTLPEVERLIDRMKLVLNDFTGHKRVLAEQLLRQLERLKAQIVAGG